MSLLRPFCLVVSLAVCACGARTGIDSLDREAFISDTSVGDVGTDDGRDGAGGRCPSAGTPCAEGGQLCEEGESPNPICNATVICLDGRWVTLSSARCRPVESTAPDCPGSVPAVDSDCAVSGRCLFPTTPDGGSAFCRCQLGHWECERATCPLPRPNLGAPCSTEGKRCDYGRCDTLWGFLVVQVCRTGRWTALERVAC